MLKFGRGSDRMIGIGGTDLRYPPYRHEPVPDVLDTPA